MKKYLCLVVVILFSLVTSCQPRPKTPNHKVQINIGSDPRTLDPRKSRDLNEKVLMNMFFEGLMREGKTGKNELALAESVEVLENGSCYLFHLKEAYWSNGDRVCAQDFVYAWTKSLDPSFPSENAYQLFCIKNASAVKAGEKEVAELGAKALDDVTLQINLEAPIPYFLDLLSFSIFFPVHPAMDEKGWNLSQHPLISCGPFSLKEWKHNDFIEAVKSPTYWDAETVHLKELRLIMVSEETEMNLFEKKEIDWAGSPLSSLPFDLVDAFQNKHLLHLFPMLDTVFFRVNVEKFPFHNQNIRKAFALAINRKSLVENVTKEGYSPALRFVPETMGISSSSYFQDADEALAKELFQKGLKELGISENEFPKVSFLYSSLQKNHTVAQAVQQDWKRVLGVSVELESNERKVYFDRIGRQDYEMAYCSWIADFNDPVNFLEVFKHKKGSTNNTLWENSEYTGLLNASDTASFDQRINLLRRCEEILMNEMPIIPVYHRNMRYAKQDRLKQVVLSSLGNIDFKWAYLEEKSR